MRKFRKTGDENCGAEPKGKEARKRTKKKNNKIENWMLNSMKLKLKYHSFVYRDFEI